jgi:hypothetical protein
MAIAASWKIHKNVTTPQYSWNTAKVGVNSNQSINHPWYIKTSLFQFLTWTHFSFMCWAWFKTENNEKQPTNLKEKNNKSNNHHTRSVSIFKSIRCDYCCLTSNNDHTRSVSIFISIRCDYCCLTSNNHHTRSMSIFKSIRCDYCCLTSNNHHTRSVKDWHRPCMVIITC